MKDADGTFYREDETHLGARFNVEGKEVEFHTATREPLEPFARNNAKLYYGRKEDLDGKHTYRGRIMRDGFAVEFDNGVVFAGDFRDTILSHDVDIDGTGEWEA